MSFKLLASVGTTKGPTKRLVVGLIISGYDLGLFV